LAKAKAASPLSSAWGECQGLVEAIDAAPDQREVRVRLRNALGRILKEVWCLFVGVGATRLAAVQMLFEGAGAGTT
jgi:hypothetical protein